MSRSMAGKTVNVTIVVQGSPSYQHIRHCISGLCGLRGTSLIGRVSSHSAPTVCIEPRALAASQDDTIIKIVFDSIHDRFVRSNSYRSSQQNHGWTEETCKQMGELELEDHPFIATFAERARYEYLWSVFTTLHW